MSAFTRGTESQWGAGDQYGAPPAIAPTGLASTLAFGTPHLNPPSARPNGRASTIAFGTPTMAGGAVVIHPTGIASTLTLGRALPTIPLTGRASTLTFGAPTFSAIVTLHPTGRTSTLALGAPTITPGLVTVALTGIASTAAIGTPIDRPRLWGHQWNRTGWGAGASWGGSISLVAGIGAGTTFGAPNVIITIHPTGIASTVLFGTPIEGAAATVLGFTWGGATWGGRSWGTGPRAALVHGIASTVAFGSLRGISQAVPLGGIASTIVFGVFIPPQPGAPTGIDSTSTFGTTTVGLGRPGTFGWGAFADGTFGGMLRGAVVYGRSRWATGDRRQGPDDAALDLDGITSTSRFGTAHVSTHSFPVAGAPSTIVFGHATLIGSGPQGAPSTLRFGAPPTLHLVAYLTPGGITSTSTFGTTTFEGQLLIAPLALVSTISFGDALPTIPLTGIASTADVAPVTLNAIVISPAGIASTATVGTPTVASSAPVAIAGASSTVAFGSPTVRLLGPTLTAIASTLDIGAPVIIRGGVIILPGIDATSTLGTPHFATSAAFDVLAIVSTVAFGTLLPTIPSLGIASTVAFGTPHVANVPRVPIECGDPAPRWIIGAAVARWTIGAATNRPDAGIVVDDLDFGALAARWNVGGAEYRWHVTRALTARWVVGDATTRTTPDEPLPTTVHGTTAPRWQPDPVLPALVP